MTSLDCANAGPEYEVKNAGKTLKFNGNLSSERASRELSMNLASFRTLLSASRYSSSL